MALDTTASRISYSGNGSTTVFSFPYRFLEDTDLVVVERVTATGVETTKTLTTHYTVSGAGDDAGGSVTMLTAPASGVTLTIYRDPEITQGVDLEENEAHPAETEEEALDKLTMIAQRLSNRMDRAFTLSEGFADSVDLTLPTPSAGLALGWNDDEDGLTNLASAGDLAVSSYIETLLDDANAATARATLGFSGTSGTVAAANLHTDVVSGLTSATAVHDDYVMIADSSASSVAKKALVSDIKNVSATASKTTTYTATTADEFIPCDATGGAFTVTLYAASGNAGRQIRIKKTDSSVNAVTIDGNGAETIDGATTKKCSTQYETLTLVCDGTGWHVLNRAYPQVWTSTTPTGSWSSNTTYTGRYRRVGDTCEYKVYVLTSGAPTSATLTINLPFTVDTTKLPAGTPLVTNTRLDSSGLILDDGSSNMDACALYTSTTSVTVACFTASGSFSQVSSVTQANPMTWASGDSLEVTIKFPVSGWEG